MSDTTEREDEKEEPTPLLPQRPPVTPDPRQVPPLPNRQGVPGQRREVRPQ